MKIKKDDDDDDEEHDEIDSVNEKVFFNHDDFSSATNSLCLNEKQANSSISSYDIDLNDLKTK